MAAAMMTQMGVEGRHGYQCHYGGADASKGSRHYLVLAELVEEHGYQQDNKKRGQGSGYARHDGGRCLAQLVAYEGADIDGENARTALRDGDQV